MREEDLVTPEWAKDSESRIAVNQYDETLCARCGVSLRRHSDHPHSLSLHRTDPVVNLQPGQTVEEERRGYVQREDGSWETDEGLSVVEGPTGDMNVCEIHKAPPWPDGVLTGEPTVQWPTMCGHCHARGPLVDCGPGKYDAQKWSAAKECEHCGAVCFIEKRAEPDEGGMDLPKGGLLRGEYKAKIEPPTAYTCAPGCNPANPCMSEEVSHAWNIDDVPCLARRHLREEEAISWDNRSKGVADPVAKVKSPMVPGVRWNGRASR